MFSALKKKKTVFFSWRLLTQFNKKKRKKDMLNLQSKKIYNQIQFHSAKKVS